jgi:hypothetical protein
LVIALAEHRAGRLQAADEWLTRTEKVLNNDLDAQESGYPALLLFGRALVKQGLGQADAAREALDQADRIVKKHWPHGERTANMGEWRIWAWSQTLRAEAETLRKAGPAPKGP